MSPSVSWSDNCSGQDCLFCGALPSREEQAWASLDAFLDDTMQAEHDFGVHDEQPVATCDGCQLQAQADAARRLKS